MTGVLNAGAFGRRFLEFVDASPSPWHCVEAAKKMLARSGFEELRETAVWSLKPNGRYFFTRNQSTILAFAVGGRYAAGSGANVVGAHTDSPNLRVKPHSAKAAHGYQMVGVAPYGGGLWHTWFDRDLSVAGRVVVATDAGSSSAPSFAHRLVRVDRPLLKIPNLCIHLQSADERRAFGPNAETELGGAVLSAAAGAALSAPDAAASPARQRHHAALVAALGEALGVAPDCIHDFDLCLFDVQPGALVGAAADLVSSPRLDNQGMSYAALEGLVASLADGNASLSGDRRVRMVALFDNEEVGSATQQGAASALLESTLRRMFRDLGGAAAAADADAVERSFRDTFLISADMAHAVHPAYPQKHEANHQPALHGGPVLKHNANARYATSAVTAFLVKETARRCGVPLQEFVVRNDSPCGSTIGPILASNCGVRTIDLGAPMLSMHSIRETCAADDLASSAVLFEHFFSHFTDIDAHLQIE